VSFRRVVARRVPWVMLLLCLLVQAVGAEPSFQKGLNAYRAGQYGEAAQFFRESMSQDAASGTLLNLGISEWRRGNLGNAILAWQRANWLNPFDAASARNLQFARDTAQLDSPELRWYERASTWLPANVWTWTASGGLALALAAVVLPGFFRTRKAGWHQALAALGWCVVLVSIAPCAGVMTRSNIAIIYQRDTSLLLTPTKEAEVVSSLPMGESVRKLRTRGDYVLVRTQSGLGWIERAKAGFICPQN
jgi:tetratricopeptide (TPR) repeat protein